MFPKLTEKRLQSYKEAEQQAKAHYASTLTQIFSGFLPLRIFHAFDGINRLHDEANDGLCKKKLDFRRIRGILYAGAYGCGNLVFLGTWVVGLFFAAKGLVTLPALIAFAQLMTFVAGPVQIISERYAATVAAAAVCRRVRSFLHAPTDETIGRWTKLKALRCGIFAAGRTRMKSSGILMLPFRRVRVSRCSARAVPENRPF